MGYSFRLTAWVLLYAPSHRQDSTYHGLCYTSRGALAGTRNSSMGPPWRTNPMTHRTMSECSYHGGTSRSPYRTGHCYISNVKMKRCGTNYRLFAGRALEAGSDVGRVVVSSDVTGDRFTVSALQGAVNLGKYRRRKHTWKNNNKQR